MSGWIKLHRSLLDWRYYDDNNAVRLLIHLLVSVNYEPTKWHEITINSGQMVCSWDTLSQQTGLSKQQVRTAMSKLERSGEVTRKATNKWQLITLRKWDELQSVNTQTTDKPTDNQHSNNRQITPIKESKEYKEIKEEKKRAIFLDWLTYRKEIKKSIKNKSTLDKLVDKFNSESLDKVEWVVNHSIENQYQGLFWDKYGSQNNTKSGLKVNKEGRTYDPRTHYPDGRLKCI